MIYFGVFDNVKNETISVVIGTNGDSAIVEGDSAYDYWNANGKVLSGETYIELGETPVELELNSDDGLFDTIKATSCTVTLLTKTYYPDMYTGEAQDVDIAIRNETLKKSLFYGYMTPCAYNQEYSYLDELELEFVSPISSLDNIKYTDDYTTCAVTTFYNIIKKCLQKTKFYTSFYFPNLYRNDGTSGDLDADFLNSIKLNEYNFIEDDDEHMAKTCKEVLESISLYLGVTLVEYKTALYFLDYNGIVNSYFDYIKYDISDDTSTAVTLTSSTTIDKTDYYDGCGEISYDEVYNKISCSCNTYEIENTADASSLFEYGRIVDDKLKGGYGTIPIADNDPVSSEYDYIHTDSNSHPMQYINNVYQWRVFCDGKEFYSFQAFIDDNPKIKQYWYENDSDTLVEDKAVNLLNVQQYRTGFLTKSSSYSANENGWEYGTNIKSVDLKNYIELTSRYKSNGKGGEMLYNASKVPLLTIKDTVKYIKRSNSLYLAVNFKCIYQDLNKVPTVVDDCEHGECNNGLGIYARIRVGNYYLYGIDTLDWTGFDYKVWYGCVWKNNKGYIQTENYYWQPQEYFDDLATKAKYSGIYPRWYFQFDINDEDAYLNKELSLFDNCSWDMGIGSVSGNIFKLPDDITFGDEIEITFYKTTPNNTGEFLESVFLSDFEFGVYESSVVKISTTEDDDGDIVYTNETKNLELNKDIVEEFDNLEIDINTQVADRDASYSSVFNSDGSVNEYIYNIAVGEESWLQEYNLIYKYYQHYKKPRLIYEAEFCTEILPYGITYLPEVDSTIKMCLDSDNFDVKNDNHEINLIEYGV